MDKSMSMDEMTSFVKEYGSYLTMHTCLAYSDILKAEEVIDLLLEVAKFDPRHREVMKHVSRANALVFYEPVCAIFPPGSELLGSKWDTVCLTFFSYNLLDDVVRCCSIIAWLTKCCYT